MKNRGISFTLQTIPKVVSLVQTPLMSAKLKYPTLYMKSPFGQTLETSQSSHLQNQILDTCLLNSSF